MAKQTGEQIVQDSTTEALARSGEAANEMIKGNVDALTLKRTSLWSGTSWRGIAPARKVKRSPSTKVPVPIEREPDAAATVGVIKVGAPRPTTSSRPSTAVH